MSFGKSFNNIQMYEANHSVFAAVRFLSSIVIKNIEPGQRFA